MAEYTEEDKKKGGERDVHVSEKNNLVVNYMVEVLEIMNNHKHNHGKLIQENTEAIRNKILKPMNGRYIDFQGKHYTVYKKIKDQSSAIEGHLKTSIQTTKDGLKKLKTLVKINTDLSKQGLPPKKDTAKALIRLGVHAKQTLMLVQALSDKFVLGWQAYSDAMVEMNATIHKDLISFYEMMKTYAFSSDVES